jgi:hypothetical protein
MAVMLPPVTIMRRDNSPMLKPSGSRSSCAIKSKRGKVMSIDSRNFCRILSSTRVVQDNKRNPNLNEAW